MKNLTHVSSLMGTWTWFSKLRVTTYNIQAALVMHITPDPLRQLGCETPLQHCEELDGQFCQLNTSTWQPECHNMNDTIATAGDALVYYHLTFQVDGNFPLEYHGTLGTKGWVGPFTVLWAPSDHARYTIRYVETQMTKFLSRHLPEDNFFPPQQIDDDHFYQSAYGPPSVKETIRRQTQLTPGKDPFEGNAKNCDQGTIRPVLPMVSFDITNNNTIDWQLDYHLLIAPVNTHVPLARFLPIFAAEVNSIKSLGVSVDGPYCWEDDPKRVWMWGLSLNSTSIHKTTVQVTKGCVEGFPCRPELLLPHGSGSAVVPNDCPSVNLNNSALLWKLTTTLLLILWTCTVLPLCCCCGKDWWSRTRSMRSQEPTNHSSQDGSNRDPADTNDASEPLLPQNTSTPREPTETLATALVTTNDESEEEQVANEGSQQTI